MSFYFKVIGAVMKYINDLRSVSSINAIRWSR